MYFLDLLKEREVLKKKQEWQLRDLRLLDGLAPESPDMRLDLEEERYTWTCTTLQEKESFLKVGEVPAVPPVPTDKFISQSQ